ncbi:amidohydrolase [Roseiconus nitratireducens]|uniref:Amidohydrolase n=1 Tax=Roseiconus nitratireducens TaxID=2605748 RepID=A0A5M6DNA5_9BACT|nr:amidohydrolase [Roseiconus nitratireducens]KAA5546905.1 amidohydrolase [Roseiconus nitratireducens]
MNNSDVARFELPQACADAIDQIAKELDPQWLAMRRHLHKYPELSGHESLTTQYLKSRLAELELPIRVAGEGRGLTADLITDPSLADGRRIAIRGDIDALPIQDEKAAAYRSTVPGVMHACGHDVHATIIVATMQLLSEMRARATLPWPIGLRGILQPSEETAQGARHMIHHHALAGVDAIIALHVDPTRQVGCIGLREGLMTAACDLFEVEFNGRGGHGARPHLADDPIDACTRWVQSAYRRVPRAVDPHTTVVLSVGKLAAGQSANVIPDSARLSGTLRSLSIEARRKALETLEDVCEAIARETNCRVDLSLGLTAPAVRNDVDLTRMLWATAAQILDPAAVERIDVPSMGSEDFSYYLEHVPGVMFRLGVAGEQVGGAPLHTSLFDVDERAIGHAARLLAASVITYFHPNHS